MEETIMDRVVDLLHERLNLVWDELKKQFRKTKPFRMEPVDNNTLLDTYERMTPEDIQRKIQSDGIDAYMDYVMEMDKLRASRARR